MFDRLVILKDLIEKELTIDLDEIDSMMDWGHVEEVYLHQACQAAVFQMLPRLRDLEPALSAALHAVMTRLLEEQIGPSVGLRIHPAEDFLGVPNDYQLPIANEYYNDFMGMWRSYFWPEKDLAGMALVIQGILENGPMLCHILPGKDWEEAKSTGLYKPASLESEGFIHCSTMTQVIRSANRFFEEQTDLLLMWIVEERVQPEILYEDLAGEGMLFPHIYGPLNLDAVAYTSRLPLGKDGKFDFPKIFEETRNIT